MVALSTGQTGHPDELGTASSRAACTHAGYPQTALKMTLIQPQSPVSAWLGWMGCVFTAPLLLSPLLWHHTAHRSLGTGSG